MQHNNTQELCAPPSERDKHIASSSKALCSTTPPARVRKMAERLIKSAIQQIPDQRTETVIQLTTLVTLLL
jgi:hypothetical protein